MVEGRAMGLAPANLSLAQANLSFPDLDLDATHIGGTFSWEDMQKRRVWDSVP